MEIEKLFKEFLKVARDSIKPIDLKKLIDEGILEKKGRSYYVIDIKRLPDNAKACINTFEISKKGLRVTFSKPSKKLINAVKKYDNVEI